MRDLIQRAIFSRATQDSAAAPNARLVIKMNRPPTPLEGLDAAGHTGIIAVPEAILMEQGAVGVGQKCL